MKNLSAIGRIFYGTAMAGLGFQAIFYKDFPYMLIPANHGWIPGLTAVSYIAGALLMLAGVCIVFTLNTRPVALWLGGVLLLIFCIYFVPYQLLVSKNHWQFGDWENAEKELALAGGAFVIAGCFAERKASTVTSFLAKLVPAGAIIFGVTILCFGIDHFLYAKEAAGYVPAWIPNHVFWLYFAGVPLICSGVSVIFNIKRRLIAALLGIMIFIWVIILHIPYAIANPFGGMGGEVTSAFLALGYSGIAFVISAVSKK